MKLRMTLELISRPGADLALRAAGVGDTTGLRIPRKAKIGLRAATPFPLMRIECGERIRSGVAARKNESETERPIFRRDPIARRHREWGRGNSIIVCQAKKSNSVVDTKSDSVSGVETRVESSSEASVLATPEHTIAAAHVNKPNEESGAEESTGGKRRTRAVRVTEPAGQGDTGEGASGKRTRAVRVARREKKLDGEKSTSAKRTTRAVRVTKQVEQTDAEDIELEKGYKMRDKQSGDEESTNGKPTTRAMRVTKQVEQVGEEDIELEKGYKMRDEKSSGEQITNGKHTTRAVRVTKRNEQTDEDDIEVETGFKMSRVCDRLIEVFLTEKTTPAEWKSLLILSEQWSRIRPYFFKRCSTKAKAETDSKKRRDLLKLSQQLQEVDKLMMKNDALFAEIEQRELELDIIVAMRRVDFTGDFFEYMGVLGDTAYKSLKRRDEIAALAGKCLSFVEAHDAALEDPEAITEAQFKFNEILESSSLEAAADKVRQLARNKELDSTLILLITKAWGAAKESKTIKQETKDIMSHLYHVARDSMGKLIPDEVRIIKYLLQIQDPRERFAAMTDTFSPGDDIENKREAMLYTSPEKLRRWVKIVLDAFHMNKQTTLIQEARDLTNPEIITRLQGMMEFLDDQFI